MDNYDFIEIKSIHLKNHVRIKSLKGMEEYHIGEIL